MATSKAPNLTGVVPALSGPSDSIVPALERIDPFLRFLTKATGKTMVPLQMLQSVLPKSSSDADQNGDTSTAACCGVTADEILLELTHRGVLHYQADKQIVGFPLPPSADNSTSANKVSTSVSSVLPKPPSLIGKGLHGSSKAVAKRRMKVLMWSLGKEPSWICRMKEGSTESVDTKKKTATKNKNTERACTTSISAVKEDTTITISAPGDNSKKISLTHAQQLSLNSDNHNSEGTKQHATPDTEVNGDVAGESSDRTLAYRALHNLFSKNNENVTMSKPDSVETSYNSIDGEHKGEQQTKRHWLPCQAAFAGSHPGRESRYGTLSKETLDMIPVEVLDFFNLNIDSIRGSSYEKNNEITEQINVVKTEYNTVGCTYAASSSKRKLYLHQAQAIEAAMTGVHTVVCTGTGSGKSLCFLLPVVAKALNSLKQKSADGNANLGSASILLFPTKALAQDQLTKINVLLESLASQSNGKRQLLRAGVIDGDTPHSERDTIASECQLILTNPDTLHAAILPNWRRPSYKQLLGCVSTVVIDEAHVYEGTFGAHVALVLSRLKRICCVASSEFTPLQVASESNSILPYTTTNSPKKACPFFIACSATMAHPEQHFRALCRIVDEESVCVLSPDDDGSPCGPKHYFVWNPPILDVNGNSTESVFVPKKDTNVDGGTEVPDDHSPGGNRNDIPLYQSKKRRRTSRKAFPSHSNESGSAVSFSAQSLSPEKFIRRRHAADETAFLFAKAVASNIRCIAFCKTRCLVEWVYESTLSILRSDDNTAHLVSRIESYRGGYSASERRSIEGRLFRGELWGVVGTNALELGVDVGGIDLTLHCGYPGTKNSLLQQSGRAGRGRGCSSCAIVVCFNSPSEQYLWKAPQTILSKAVGASSALPISGSVLQGHLLCAGEEFPLTGSESVSCLLNEIRAIRSTCPSDEELFGSGSAYYESVDHLVDKSVLRSKVVRAVRSNQEVSRFVCHETHPVMKNAWKRVSLRSIEPLNYNIIDLSHPLQAGRTDKLMDKAAVLDTIPYSRVFYHAYPGAIIMHRGRRFKIESLESPPAFLGGSTFGRNCSDLCSFARPVQVTYSTQALSINEITINHVHHSKELRITESGESDDMQNAVINSNISQTVAGRGIVTVKRSVHGYKKLSHVNRKEISRTNIILPAMEFDTEAIWIDADASNLRDLVMDFDSGVHALSHAMVAVASVFTPCTSEDIDCDHSRFECTRVLMYDTRAGGSGATSSLYDKLTDLLQCAVELLDDCTSCHSEAKYDGGCPGCLHSVPCDNFQQDLSRRAGITIGKYLLERLKRTASRAVHKKSGTSSTGKLKAVLIGRPSWLENREHSQFAEIDE